MTDKEIKFNPADARHPDARPLPRQRGLTYMTNRWGMINRHGANSVNTIRPERPEIKTKYVGFRLVADLTLTNSSQEDQ